MKLSDEDEVEFPSRHHHSVEPSAYATTLPTKIETNYLAPSRLSCTVHVDDGDKVREAGRQELPDNGQDITHSSLRYNELTLDLDRIKLSVPEPYHLLLDNTLGTMAPGYYANEVCEILIEWTI